MQRGNIAESAGPSVAVGCVGKSVIGVVIAASAVPVEPVFSTKFETLVRLSGLQEEVIVYFCEEIPRPTLGNSRG